MRKLVLAIVIFSLLGTVVVAWNDCPYGLVNDPFPGLCRRYIDTNTDGFCDHSQIAPASTINPVPVDTSEDGVIQDSDQANQDLPATGIYHVIPITIILTLLYIATYLLSKKAVIRLADHRKLWNWALLVTFLVSALTGLVLAICINFGWQVPFSTDTLFFHVELGIAMAIISFFHILWHWNYWKGKTETSGESKKKKIKRK